MRSAQVELSGRVIHSQHCDLGGASRRLVHVAPEHLVRRNRGEPEIDPLAQRSGTRASPARSSYRAQGGTAEDRQLVRLSCPEPPRRYDIGAVDRHPVQVFPDLWRSAEA